MARAHWFPIARALPQVVHRGLWIIRRRESQQLASAGLAFDDEAIARQRLAAGDVAQLEGEALERRQARRT